MTDLANGERQVAPSIEGIRRDHVARYEFAANLLGEQKRVVDLACGIGYGSALLADAGHTVIGIDRCQGAVDYGKTHFHRYRVVLCAGDIMEVAGYERDAFDAAVCFETIEHLEDPLPMLKALSVAAPVLVASVPNEAVFPHGGRIKFHHRHYTRDEFKGLLESAGYEITGWYGQIGPQSEVEPDVEGRTIVVTAARVADGVRPASAEMQPDKKGAPRRVVILGLGPSLEMYSDHVKRLGGRKAFADEVWAINALGDLYQCDRIFHMDDLRIQEARAKAVPGSNIACMVEWLKRHPGPVYTSQIVDGYPGLVAFPLEEVINSTGQAYFNSTAAYAVAYAVHIGVEEINLFGIDFSYPNAHQAEKGRACVEFWLGMASARGIRVGVPENTSLLDTIEGHDAHFYGYDAVKVKLDTVEDVTKVTFEPRELPSAAAIEARYDHTKHPNPHVSGQAKGA
ncbi:class I SAM-dependent methyltransferase [Allomesorhizobium camelthorni]|uniref:Methyltransferase domain-containing protein n=1 Tax=Allomesorhizobium camelthorni TaxID=475069 RepID=A0A6G4W8G3_9HYPH|nr:class I SAM-dependent methyltransferase [Mesorhizobium camelthorni]NGO50437.1 methyltransferase domain-containing protein [Mesorhizobium camelthorni]